MGGPGRRWPRCLGGLLAVVVLELSQSLVAPIAAGATSVAVLSRGSRAVPVVALTIDDGYSPKNCRRAAEILLTEHATATFFPVAEAVLAAPDTWRWIARQGFPIGNHTASHRSLTRSAQIAYAEIVGARRSVESVIGRSTVRVVRPPRGEWDEATVSAAGAAGYGTVLLWDTSFADTASKTDAAHLSMATRGTYGSVILMHCGAASSIRILPAVIHAYRSRGISFVTVPELLRLRAAPETWAGFARAQPSGPYVPAEPIAAARRVVVPRAAVLDP